MRTRRYASVWLPNWPAQRLARQPHNTPPEPFIIARTEKQKRLVHAVSQQAHEAGITCDSTVALAQACVPNLTVIDHVPEADEKALMRVAIWALRYSPLITLSGADGMMLDTGGADHLLGGEERLLADLSTRLHAQGLRPRIAMSSTQRLSWALARYAPLPHGPGTIVPKGEERETVIPLPIEALDLPPATTKAARRLGFERIEELLNAPRAGLALRLGSELITRLDQLLGRAAETFEPISAPETVSAKTVFAEPIAHLAGIEGALDLLAKDLCGRLDHRNEGARILDLYTTRVDGETTSFRVLTTAPTREPAHLCRLFSHNLDKIDPGFGIERMTLSAPLTEKVRATQRDISEEAHKDLSHLVDRLVARIGEKRVFCAAPTEHDLPERAFRITAPTLTPAALSWDRGPRPIQLLSPPERVEVIALLPDHPPARFTWRGQQKRVARADGPECIFGEWWTARDEVALTRDYYRVEDDAGGRWWLFRARNAGTNTAEWFLHGVFG